MNLETNAIYLQRTYLSKEEVLTSLSYLKGAKFTSKKTHARSTIEGCVLTVENELVYLLRNNKTGNIRFVSPKSLKKAYDYINPEYQRFALIDLG